MDFFCITTTLLEPDTPEWQLWLVLIIAFAILAIGGGLYLLERKITGPYTLTQASSGQKWKWAVILAFPQTIIVPRVCP
ncbi:MAG: hypothetical protein JXA42_23025 [Anaerolineales bacterium]|nr:hypothetical protein [Anaerolineales bacterium]